MSTCVRYPLDLNTLLSKHWSWPPVMVSMPFIRCPSTDSPTTSPSYLEPLKHLQQENSEEQRLGEGSPVAQSRHWAGCQTTVYQKWLRLSSQNDPSNTSQTNHDSAFLFPFYFSFEFYAWCPQTIRGHWDRWNWRDIKQVVSHRCGFFNYQVIFPGSLYSD